MGGGLGLAFLPVTGIVSKHFKRRRALAMGIITTGTSLGGFAFSLIANKLLYTDLGFDWTVRISAFIVLGSTIFANLLLSDIPPEKADVVHRPEEGTAGATGDAEKTENDNDPTASDREGQEDSTAPPHKPRTMKDLLRDPAYLAIISMGFVVSLGLYFPPSAAQSRFPQFLIRRD